MRIGNEAERLGMWREDYGAHVQLVLNTIRCGSFLLLEAGLVSVCPEGATCFQLYVALWGLLLYHLHMCVYT